jgi:lysophospholipase L1-like esterase
MLPRALKSILVAAAALAALECAARVANTLEDDWNAPAPYERPADSHWSQPSAMLGWERRPEFRGSVNDIGNHPRAFDARGLFTVDGEQLADGSMPVVLFVGDSNTFGWGVRTEESFPEVVDRLLPLAAVNVAVPGYSSYQGMLDLERHLGAPQPVLVVIAFGFNDRRYVAPPDTPDDDARMARIAGREAPATQRWWHRLHLVKAMNWLLARAGGRPRMPTKGSVETLPPRVDELAYGRNLRRMIEAARARGSRVLLVTLNDSPIMTQHLCSALQAEPRAAIAHLSVLERSGTAFADLARLHLVHAYRAIGDTRRAASVARTTLVRDEDGGWPVRMDRDYAEIARAVGAELGVPVFDGGAIVDEHPGDYLDMCHFNAAAHARLGESLAARIGALLR